MCSPKATCSGCENGGPDATRTFVLIANTANTPGEATLTVLPDRAFTGAAPAPIVVAMPANSRTTVPISAVDGTFGVRVVSTGGSPVPQKMTYVMSDSTGDFVNGAAKGSVAIALDTTANTFVMVIH